MFKSYKLLLLGAIFALGLVLGSVQFTRSYAASPPATAWANFSGSLTRGTTGVVVTASTGNRIIVKYAQFSASAAGVFNLREHPATGSDIYFATIGLNTTTPFELLPNTFFGGEPGYVTGVGSSILIENATAGTLTPSGTIRYTYD